MMHKIQFCSSFKMHINRTVVESFKIVSNEWYLSCNTNATNCHCFIYGIEVRRCSVKKVLLEISKNSQENTCARA